MSGPLFLHGFGASGRVWDGVRALLPEARRGSAPDLPGFGGAADLPRPSLAGYVDHLLRTEGDLSGRWVVAHSMSGKLAFELAARPQGAPAGLVLAAPTTSGPEPMSEEGRAALRGWPGDKAVARSALAAELTREIAPEVFDAAVEDRAAMSQAAADWWALDGSLQDLRGGLRRLGLPVVVLVGARDALLGEAAQRRELLPHLARPSLAVTPDTGHLIPLEAAEAVAGAVREAMA